MLSFQHAVYKLRWMDQWMVETILTKTRSYNDRQKSLLILSLIWELLPQRNRLDYFVFSQIEQFICDLH